MPRKKSEFKPLTYKEIGEISPERKKLSVEKNVFENILSKALKQLPFDKKKK